MPETFEHACFISYKHPPKTARGDRHFYKEFVQEFQKRLEYYLNTEIRTFLDTDSDPGSSYPKELSRKLCKSVCLIAVLVPEYPDSEWCKAEWEAMVKLESKRLGEGKVGLIIPIALRRKPEEWNSLLKRKPIDFSSVAVPIKQLDSVKNSQKIQEIADLISGYVKRVPEPCDDCTQFMLAVAEDKLQAPPTFPDPDPFD
jgi:TIR domain